MKSSCAVAVLLCSYAGAEPANSPMYARSAQLRDQMRATGLTAVVCSGKYRADTRPAIDPAQFSLKQELEPLGGKKIGKYLRGFTGFSHVQRLYDRMVYTWGIEKKF